ncbi:MAG: amino acid adenylation domain-containing protein, partial [Acidobacteriota bacterium]
MDKKNIEAIYPLSPAQLGMLLYLVVAGDGERSNAFYEQYHCTLHGDLDPELFREAWERTVARHASLRTLFLWERREKPLQVVLRSVELPFTVEDWRGRDAEQEQADFDALRLGERAAGLKLDRAPLVRCHLRRVGDRAHRFLWCFSHLTLDGWSIALVLGEVFSTYHALTEGKEPSLPAAKPFRDYIAWLQDQDLAEAERFWRRNLEGIPGATSLPIDRGAGTAMTDAATRLETTGRETVDIDPGLWNRIQEVARSRGLTPNAFFQGTWGLLLGRYAGEDDVVYGSVVSGRTPEVDGVESIAGMFINALPVRARLDPARPFAQWLGDLQLQLVEQRQFEYCPLEQIQRWIGLPHDRPAFESLLAYENYPAAEGESDLRMEVGDLEEVSNYPLLCYVVVGERPRLRLAWDRSRYSDDDARALLRRYARLLSNLADSPDTPIGQVPLTTVDERTSLDRLAAAPAADWPDDACVHQLVARAAERTPGAVALRGADGSEVTYRQLVDRSRRLGRHLSGLGVGPDAVVAVSMERSPAMAVALLGVLEAGGAYLPLDPDYPRDRLAFMLEDSGARVLVAQEDLADRFPAVPHVVTVPKGDGTVFPELSAEPVDSGVGPEHLAYVIYTSGSTGKPKGVQVEHRNLVHYAEDARRVYGLRADDRVLQFATISFDTSAEEIYPALFAGAALVLRSEEMIASPGAFLKELGTLGITLLNLPTAFWHEVCAGLAGGGEDDDQDGSIPACLERVIIGGEAALAGRLEQWHRHLEAAGRGLGSDGPVRLWNTYGPTETTIVTTRHELTAWHPEDHGGEVPIGRPIDNARAYVLDPELRPLPPGIPGELAVGGPGVTRGYLGRPELTAERFPSDPIDPSRGRVYRTGDRVAMAEDGTLLFRGRVDQQVKVRGFRIEPGEIESALLRHDAVHDAVVVARVDGADTRLVAYFVAAEGHDDPSLPQLREALAADLPDYMVPAAFVSLDALPMTPSGKVDRRALPAPDASALGSGVPHVAPRTPIESALRDLWVELLGHDRIGVHDDFFQLGGHSLLVGRLVTRVRKEMRVELPLVAVFENPTLAELAQRVEAGLRDDTGGTEPGSPGKLVELPPIVKVDRDGPLPLSYPQERIWFLQMLEPNSVAYNFQMTVWFDGPLNVEALRRSLTEIVRRHEVFHAVFPEVDGKPAMVIEGPWEVELPVIDLRHVPEIDREDAAERALRAETAKAFDITQLPLIRWHLVRLEDQRHMLIQVEHHFVHDGWSLGILLRELLAIYKAYSAGEPSPLPELDIQFGDFTSWQRRVVAGETLGGLVDHWKRRLDGMPMVLDLPTDHPRPNRPSTQGEAEMFPLPDDLYAGLRSFGKDQGYTLYMTTLAAFYALMYRYTGQTDMGVGAGVANRRQREQEGIIGFTVNTVVMRGDLSGDPTFLELLARVRETSLDAFAHQDMPFEKLVEALRPERHVSRNPIFQVMFSFHDAAVPRLDFGGGLLAKYLVRTNRSAKTDLNVIIAPQAEQQVGMKQGDDPRGKPQRAVVTWEYNRELFEPETIDRMIEHYKVLALDAITHPTKRLSELDMLTDGERGQLGTWSSRPAPFPREATIHGLFQGIAGGRPDAAAVRCGDDALTYGELASRASRLARHLRSLGVGPETAVALALGRGIELVTAQLAVLEAGGFFVPLDPAYPAERLRVMLEDTGAALVLSLDGGAGGGLPADLSEGLRVVDLGNFDWNAGDGSPLAGGPAPAADNLAYVMFTSGSTGRPKGVAVSHRNVVRLVRGNDFAAMDEDEVWMGFAPAAFDASTLEIWAPLLNGGELVQLPAGDLDLGSLAAEIRSAGVTSLWLTAGLFHPMAEGGHLADLPSVRQLLAGGDSLSADRIRDALDQLPEGARVINGYGPTENTTFTTCHPMTRGDDIPASVPIGRPIRNTRVLVTDPDLRSVAGGVYGELLAGGDGLARGYFGRPALTAERFVPDPSATEPGDRVYRTGDRARWLRDGTLEFQGRVDFQVKIRGFRIEPGEIQAVLGGHPNVADAAVIARDDGSGGKRLVAYVVPGPAALEGADFAADLRTYLGSRLPDYMVPTAFVRMGTLPLNANGKVDRTALPAPDAGADADEVRTPPSSPVEELVADLWADVLGLGGDSLPLDVHTDFFALGGHSLIAMQLMARLREQLGVELPLRRLFQANTVAAMAEVVAEQLTEGLPKALPLVAQDGPEDQPLPLSFAQQRLWFLYRYDPASSVYNMPSARRLQGDLDVDALARALTEIARRHRVLRSRFEEQDGQVVQIATLLPQTGLPLPVDDLRNVEESEARVTEGLQRLREAAAEPFDLEAGDVFRANLYRLADDDHLLLVSLHHIVFDGISLGVFERELAALYGAYRAGESSALPELSVQYGDFAAWQRDYLAGDALERQLDYWRGALVGADEPRELPADRPRPATPSYRGDSVLMQLPPELMDQLSALGRERGVTPFMTLLAAFQMLLGRLSGQDRVRVGSPVSGRQQTHAEGLIGFFVNTLVFGADLGDDPAFDELLGRTRDTVLSGFAHQDVPFEKLVEELQPQRDTARNPLFQVGFQLFDAGDAAGVGLPDLETGWLEPPLTVAKFDLNLTVLRGPRGMAVDVRYATDLFDRGTVERWLEAYLAVLHQVAGDPTRRLSALDLRNDADRALLTQVNDVAADYPRDVGLAELFGRAAEVHGDRVALAWDSHALTYSGLASGARRLARHLVAQGVRPGERVGLCVARGADMVTGMLGILEAGGAYVPLDPDYPADRLRFMAEDTGMRRMVVHRALSARLPDLDVERIVL